MASNASRAARALLVLVTLVSALATARAAHAQDLAGAQAALARYELASPATYDALESLRRIADANGPQAPTARAVRAYAAVDLLTAATILGDTAALERLGAVLGTRDRPQMSATLDAELARTPTGALAVAAREARATLAALEGRPALHSARTDAIVLVLAPTELAALRASVCDRFEPVIDSTLEIVPEHANDARRIVTAMQALIAAIRLADRGDPLLALLRPRMEAVRGRLAEIVISSASLDDVDTILTLRPDAIAFGHVPRTRVSLEGRPVLSSATPAWPTTTSVALPTELPAVVRPIEGLAAQPAVTGARPGRVALRIEGDVPSHLVARVVRSLEGTPLAITLLMTSEGRMPVTFVREDAVPADAARVSIRPGGYAVERRAGRRADIPRRRVEGQWQFDREGLVRALPGAGSRVLIASGSAPAAELFAAARAIAVDGAITILLP